MMTRVFQLALTIMLIGGATGALAGDLPAQAERIWAPDGDLIGAGNHAALTLNVLDAYGNAAKRAEDWQLGEDTSGSGLFYLRKVVGDDLVTITHGAGTTADGEDLTGYLLTRGKKPGRLSYLVSYRHYNQFFDRTSEIRNATFGAPPPPPALDALPVLDWSRTDLSLGYRFSGKLAVNGGWRGLQRSGTRGSLLRAATGNAAPGLKTYDALTNHEFWLGGAFAAGDLAADLTGTVRVQGGDRGFGDDHAWQEDRTSYRGRLGVQWQAAERTRVLGSGSVGKLENKGSETWGGTAVTPAGETKSSGGQLAVLQRLGQAMTLRAAADFSQSTTDASVSNGTAALQTVDRDRSRQEYRVNLTHAGLRATRLELGYRLRTSSREQILVDGTTFTTDQDQTRNEVTFKGRHRFSRRALLKLQAGWSSLDREQTRDWTDPALRYWLDDYKRDQFDWKLGVQTRPHARLRLDVGHQLIDRTDEDQVTAGVETTFKANRGYAVLNWTPRGWLTLYGTASVGVETWEIGGGVAPDAGMGPLNSDGTTWRWVPGAVVQVTPKLQAEAMYEGIRYEDDADTAGLLGTLNSDHDRVLVRVGYQVREQVTVSASYRRAEFFEQRWDNTIHDLYGLTVGARF